MQQALLVTAAAVAAAAARALHPAEQLLIDTLQLFQVSSECTTSLIVNYNFSDVPCIKHVVSKGLGFAVVFGGTVVKLPQAYNLYKAGNSAGVSFATQYLELCLYGIPVAYNMHAGNPFSTWGENVFLAGQVFLILGLMLHFERRYAALAVTMATWAAFMGTALSGALPAEALTALQGITIPISVTAKMMTISVVVRGGQTGQLALVTAVLNAFGCLGRVYTTVQEVDDLLVLSGWIAAAAMNWIVLGLFAVYPRRKAVEKKDN